MPIRKDDWTRSDNQKGLPDSDGVYTVAETRKQGVYTRYVGQGNIRDRINHHMSDGEKNDCLAEVMQGDVTVYFVLLDKKWLDDVEYTVYKMYKDAGRNLCNKDKPPGKLINGVEIPTNISGS